MSKGNLAVRLAADMAAGTITAEAIKRMYGDSVLTTVLGIGSGVVAGVVADTALDILDLS